MLETGLIVQCQIRERYIFGLAVEVLHNGEQGVIDRIYMDDDLSREPTDFPVGHVVEATVQGYMPSGQLRLSRRSADLARGRRPPLP